MKKKIISLIALLLATSLAACNGKTIVSSRNDVASSNNDATSAADASSIASSINDISSENQYGEASGSAHQGADNSSVVPSSNPISSEAPSSNPITSSESPFPSSAPIISSEIISSSIENSSSEIIPVLDPFDQMIADFVDGYNITVPALASFELDYGVIFYYAYQDYVVIAQSEDADESITNAVLALFEKADNITCFNDDDYTVEDYGYLYGDPTGYISIVFYNEDGYFYFTVFRYDGEAGKLDVSDIDTNWYVDYVNLEGMLLIDEFPEDDIKKFLDLDILVNIPAPAADAYPVYFQEETVSEDGDVYPDTAYVVFEGDVMADYINLLKTAGYTAELVEHTETTIDWDTFELVDITYYTGTAYDIENDLYIDLRQDSSENTYVLYSRLSDSFNVEKTSNTNWTDDEKDLMNEKLHQLLPFMAFGADYELYDDSDDDWTLLVLEDTYFQDLSEDYIALLLEAGFVEYDDPDYGLLYKLDNGFVYIEIFVYYENGNYLEIYFEESRIPALTGLELNDTALDIVAGASYQLKAKYNPSDAIHPLTWSSNNENVATVSNNGLVTIDENAEVGASAVITASTPSGISASCTFTVATNIVTALEFTQDSYTIIPGGETIVTEYKVLPIGATFTGSVDYGIRQDGTDYTGIDYDGFGRLYAESYAVPGTTITIFVACDTLMAYATVTVASAEITHTLTRDTFGIEQANYSKYLDYSATIDGATYNASCAGNNGIQIRTKNDPSGVVGHYEDRSCKSITFTFDSNTAVPGADRGIDIYASNSPFTIADMFGSTVTKVGTVMFDSSNLTQTYTFTSNYSYIGFRSINGAVYLPSVQIVW